MLLTLLEKLAVSKLSISKISSFQIDARSNLWNWKCTFIDLFLYFRVVVWSWNYNKPFNTYIFFLINRSGPNQKKIGPWRKIVRKNKNGRASKQKKIGASSHYDIIGMQKISSKIFLLKDVERGWQLRNLSERDCSSLLPSHENYDTIRQGINSLRQGKTNKLRST